MNTHIKIPKNIKLVINIASSEISNFITLFKLDIFINAIKNNLLVKIPPNIPPIKAISPINNPSPANKIAIFLFSTPIKVYIPNSFFLCSIKNLLE